MVVHLVLVIQHEVRIIFSCIFFIPGTTGPAGPIGPIGPDGWLDGKTTSGVVSNDGKGTDGGGNGWNITSKNKNANMK